MIDNCIINNQKQFFPRILLKFDVHLSEHCNLNCCNCNHYSPVAEEEFLSINEYESDIRRLSELFEGEMECINLMGGEPLLNKDVTIFMDLTRKYFPFGKIGLVTNGLLLSKQDESFWESCRRNDVEICITKYPINLQYDELFADITKRGVRSVAFGSRGDLGKQSMMRFPLNVKGDQDPYWNYQHCIFANDCIQLKHGKLYTCVICANASHLKKRYNLNICISDRNGVDIYEASGPEEIMERLSKPIPFCRYCDFSKSGEYADDWHISKRDVYEWVQFVFSSEDIDYLKNKENVYIFGAGNWGHKAYQKLKEKGVKVHSFLVSDKKDNSVEIDGVKVYSLDEIHNVDEASVCLIAVEGKSKTDIQHNLIDAGFQFIIPIVNEP